MREPAVVVQRIEPLEALVLELGRTLIAIEVTQKQAAELRAKLAELLGHVRAHLKDRS